MLISFSGGPDSVYLVRHLLKAEPASRLTLVYIDHGLRHESVLAEERRFVKAFGQKHGLKTVIRRAPIVSAAKRHGISDEMAGRQWRYRILAHLARLRGEDIIATAHHLDDDCETFFLKLLRGSKTHLYGMKPEQKTLLDQQDVTIIRPLLHLTKADILDALTEMNESYCVDETNQELFYTRNKVRHQLIPLLKELDPGFYKHMKDTMDFLKDQHTFMSKHLIPMDDHITVQPNGIHCRRMQGVDPFLHRQYIFSALEYLRDHHDPEFYIQSKYVELICSGQTRLSLPNGWECVQDDTSIVFHKPLDDDVTSFHASLEVNDTIQIQPAGISVVSRVYQVDDLDYYAATHDLTSTPEVAFFDADCIQGPLQIRNRQAGDRFQPFGCHYEKSLKDYMIDRKIPKKDRYKMPLFFSENRLVWVWGYQIADWAKITPKTQRILQVKVDSL